MILWFSSQVSICLDSVNTYHISMKFIFREIFMLKFLYSSFM